MGRVSKYPDELRERAVRMVADVRPQYASQWAAITAAYVKYPELRNRARGPRR
jgi:hypothetical protein